MGAPAEAPTVTLSTRGIEEYGVRKSSAPAKTLAGESPLSYLETGSGVFADRVGGFIQQTRIHYPPFRGIDARGDAIIPVP